MAPAVPSSSSTVGSVCVDALTFLRRRRLCFPPDFQSFHAVLTADLGDSSSSFSFSPDNSFLDAASTTEDLDEVDAPSTQLLLVVEFLLSGSDSFERAAPDVE